jgi:hypothetical protein
MQNFWARAADLRVLAEGYTDKPAARTLMRIAHDYDSAAVQLKARARTLQYGGGLKRRGYKRKRTEVEHSTERGRNKDSETKLEQSFT